MATAAKAGAKRTANARVVSDYEGTRVAVCDEATSRQLGLDVAAQTLD